MMGFYRELTEGIVGANESRRKDALENAMVDTGIQPLVPLLVTFITEGVSFSHVSLICMTHLTVAIVDLGLFSPNLSIKIKCC